MDVGVGPQRRLARELMLLNCGVGEDSWEEIQPVNPKGDQSWVFIGRTDAKAEAPKLGHLMQRTDSLEKTLMLGKIEGRRKRGITEDEMVGWHHRLNGHECEQALGVGEGQVCLACCSPWGHKESDMTEQLNWLNIEPLCCTTEIYII